MQVNPVWTGMQSPLTHGSPKQGVGNTLHLSPAKPGGQRQLKVSASPSWHVPPLKQGLGSHRTEKWKQRIAFSSLKRYKKRNTNPWNNTRKNPGHCSYVCPYKPWLWNPSEPDAIKSKELKTVHIDYSRIKSNRIALSSPMGNWFLNPLHLHPFQSNCSESNDLHSNDQSDGIASSPRSNRSYPTKLQIPVKFWQIAFNSKSDCISIVSALIYTCMHATGDTSCKYESQIDRNVLKREKSDGIPLLSHLSPMYDSVQLQ